MVHAGKTHSQDALSGQSQTERESKRESESERASDRERERERERESMICSHPSMASKVDKIKSWTRGHNMQSKVMYKKLRLPLLSFLLCSSLGSYSLIY